MYRRPSTARLYALCILLVLGAAAAWTVQAEEPARDAPPAKKIRDLDYGDVLFHFFQDDYFESLVRLEVNTDFNRMTHHAAEAALLSGGLYLSLGLHQEAERIFDRLLAGPVAPSVRDRARVSIWRASTINVATPKRHCATSASSSNRSRASSSPSAGCSKRTS